MAPPDLQTLGVSGRAQFRLRDQKSADHHEGPERQPSEQRHVEGGQRPPERAQPPPALRREIDRLGIFDRVREVLVAMMAQMG
jgi:hypothetical protein